MTNHPTTTNFSPKDVLLEMMARLNSLGIFIHVDQWLEQPYYDWKEIPYTAPAAFVEFLGSEYEEMSESGAQVGSDIYKVWIEVDNNAETWMGVENQSGAWDWNDICIEAHRVLQHAQLDSLASQLIRVTQMKERTDNLGIILYSMTYRALRTDATGMPESTTAAPTEFVPLGQIKKTTTELNAP